MVYLYTDAAIRNGVFRKLFNDMEDHSSCIINYVQKLFHKRDTIKSHLEKNYLF